MPNGSKDWNLNDIYYKLGEVHSTVKTTQDEMEDIRDRQTEQGKKLEKISKTFNKHLTESDTRRKQKEKEIQETKEQKQQGFVNIGLLITVASIIINVVIELVKGIFK